MKFALVPPADWLIGERVVRPRRIELLSVTFDQIVHRFVASIGLFALHRQFNRDPLRDHPPRSLVRFWAVLRGDARAVDLFHSGAGGYRAQYYRDPELGDDANRYACTRLSDRLLSNWVGTESSRGAASRSFSSENAKVWIKQGPWIRPPRVELRNLLVEKWQCDPGTADDDRRVKLWKYSLLTPDEEDRIKLMGGWLSRSDLVPLDYGYKPSRSQELHCFGFT